MAMRKILGSLLTLCFILIVTAVLLEATYRIYLGRVVAAEVEKRLHAAAKPNEQSFQSLGLRAVAVRQGAGFFLHERPLA